MIRIGAFLVVGILALACRDQVIAAFPESYVGVGVELTMDDRGARVVRVLAGGPSEKAGIKPGDVIQEVEGEPMGGKELAQAVGLLRGPAQSTVGVNVLRDGKSFALRLVRLGLSRGQDSAYMGTP